MDRQGNLIIDGGLATKIVHYVTDFWKATGSLGVSFIV
jgi:hypothetical protein